MTSSKDINDGMSNNFVIQCEYEALCKIPKLFPKYLNLWPPFCQKKKKKKERKKERKKEKGKLMWTYSLYLNTSWVILCTPNLRNNSLRPQVFLNHFGMTTYILSLLGYFYLFIFFHSVMAIFPLKSILGLYLNFCCIFLNTS